MNSSNTTEAKGRRSKNGAGVKKSSTVSKKMQRQSLFDGPSEASMPVVSKAKPSKKPNTTKNHLAGQHKVDLSVSLAAKSILSLKNQPSLKHWYKTSIVQIYKKIKKKNKVLCNNALLKKTDKAPEFKKEQERSYFHKKDTMNWLRRYKGIVPADYLYLPHEKKARVELCRIFHEFDDDNSESLELKEFVDMLMESYIENMEAKREYAKDFKASEHHEPPTQAQITDMRGKIESLIEKKMRQIYDLITEDDSLTLEQFVMMCMNKRCNDILSSMMSVIQSYRNNYKTADITKYIGVSKYLPYSFERMIKNLCYRQQRAQLYSEYGKKSKETDRMNILMKIFELDTSKITIQPSYLHKIKKNRMKKKVIEKMKDKVEERRMAENEQSPEDKKLKAVIKNIKRKEINDAQDKGFRIGKKAQFFKGKNKTKLEVMKSAANLKIRRLPKADEIKNIKEDEQFIEMFKNYKTPIEGIKGKKKKSLDNMITKFISTAKSNAKTHVNKVRKYSLLNYSRYSKSSPNFLIEHLRQGTTKEGSSLLRGSRTILSNKKTSLRSSRSKNLAQTVRNFGSPFKKRRSFLTSTDASFRKNKILSSKNYPLEIMSDERKKPIEKFKFSKSGRIELTKPKFIGH